MLIRNMFILIALIGLGLLDSTAATTFTSSEVDNSLPLSSRAGLLHRRWEDQNEDESSHAESGHLQGVQHGPEVPLLQAALKGLSPVAAAIAAAMAAEDGPR